MAHPRVGFLAIGLASILAACGGDGGGTDALAPDTPATELPAADVPDPGSDPGAPDAGPTDGPAGDPGSADVGTGDVSDVQPPEGVALPPGGRATLDAIAAKLVELRDELGIAAARAALMALLDTGWPGLDWARLADDASTITLGLDGGWTAVLITDEDPFPEAAPARRAHAGPLGRLPVRAFRAPAAPDAPAQVLGCGDAIVPPNRKVHIVNLAGGGNPESVTTANDMKDWLLSLGWTEDEIDVTQRSTRKDYTITPDTVFRQEGYGIVLFIGHGGIRVDDSGNEHYILQGFLGGNRDDGYQDAVTPERWAEYQQWFQDGLLVEGRSWSAVEKAPVADVYIRDDLLASQIALEPGALVSFIACNSVHAAEDLASAGAGPVLAWDDSVNADDGLTAWKALFAGLTDTSLGTADATLAGMVAEGTAFCDNEKGRTAQMQLGGDTRTWTLPGSMTLDADEDCLPKDADHLEVKVHFPECPEADMAFDLLPGGSRTLSPLVPTTAQVEVRVKDIDGNTLAASVRDVAVAPDGTALPDLCPCTGSLSLDVTAYPQEGAFTAKTLDIQVVPADATVGPASFTRALPNPGALDGLMPGDATLSVTARADNGDVLGTTTVQATSACDPMPAVPACLGWIEFGSANPPADTTELTVTAPSHPGALPPSRTFAPGTSATMYGFAMGQTVRFAAEARNAVGVLVGTTTFAAQVGCGPNVAEVDFALYAIRVEATPTKVPPDGTSTAAVVATLRRWQTEDLFEPTGEPMAGKAVAFDASCGTFAGPSSGVSDAQGRVTAALASAEPCVAAVRAFVAEDGTESPPAFVNFGRGVSVWIDGLSSAPDEAASTTPFPLSCVRGRFYFRDVLMVEERTFAAENLYWGMYLPAAGAPGDAVRFEFRPVTDAERCEDADPSAGPIWIHVAYPPDFLHTETVKLTGRVPVAGPVSVSAELPGIPYYDD